MESNVNTAFMNAYKLRNLDKQIKVKKLIRGELAKLISETTMMGNNGGWGEDPDLEVLRNTLIRINTSIDALNFKKNNLLKELEVINEPENNEVKIDKISSNAKLEGQCYDSEDKFKANLKIELVDPKSYKIANVYVNVFSEDDKLVKEIVDNLNWNNLVKEN